MLVDDHVAEQSQAWCHMEGTDTMGFGTAALHQHGAAHHGGPRRSSGNYPASGMDALYSALDIRIPDLTGDAELVAPGEENTAGSMYAIGNIWIEGFRAI